MREKVRHSVTRRAAVLADMQLSSLLQVDASIIGGMVISVGDRVVDLSIMTRVKRVQQAIRDGLN